MPSDSPSSTRYERRFADARQAPVLIPYITANYPSIEVMLEILTRVKSSRVGCVELGIPFSDPIADGPVIQTSFARALDRGFLLEVFFAGIAESRDSIEVPLIAMVSYSIVYRRGIDTFLENAKAAGLDGVLVPDLSFEAAADFSARCDQHGMPLTMMIAPTTSDARRQAIAQRSSPWVYYQSQAGVTGERAALAADLQRNVENLRSMTDKPVCVGFGISHPEQASNVCAFADGAVVGSALVRRLNTACDLHVSAHATADEVVAVIDEFAAELPASK